MSSYLLSYLQEFILMFSKLPLFHAFLVNDITGMQVALKTSGLIYLMDLVVKRGLAMRMVCWLHVSMWPST